MARTLFYKSFSYILLSLRGDEMIKSWLLLSCPSVLGTFTIIILLIKLFTHALLFSDSSKMFRENTTYSPGFEFLFNEVVETRLLTLTPEDTLPLTAGTSLKPKFESVK
jgi:hypothetical protein